MLFPMPNSVLGSALTLNALKKKQGVKRNVKAR